MIFDLSGAIATLGTGTYVVTRRVAAAPVGGRRAAPATSTISILASVQPATGLVVSRLPEGKRNREAMTLFTVTELKTAQDGNEPDLIVVDGGIFEVESVERWANAGNFYEVVLTRVPAT